VEHERRADPLRRLVASSRRSAKLVIRPLKQKQPDVGGVAGLGSLGYPGRGGSAWNLADAAREHRPVHACRGRDRAGVIRRYGGRSRLREHVLPEGPGARAGLGPRREPRRHGHARPLLDQPVRGGEVRRRVGRHVPDCARPSAARRFPADHARAQTWRADGLYSRRTCLAVWALNEWGRPSAPATTWVDATAGPSGPVTPSLPEPPLEPDVPMDPDAPIDAPPVEPVQ
jgi:hypothetical protein